MNPFIPHFTNECLSSIDQNKTNWPVVSKKDLIEEEINLVVQINGKKRSILRVKRDITEEEILKVMKLNQEIEKFLTKQSIKKVIFVPNRLIKYYNINNAKKKFFTAIFFIFIFLWL